MITPSTKRRPQKEPEGTSCRAAFARVLSAYGARLAWSLWALSVTLVLCSAFLLAVNLTVADEAGLGYWLNNVVAALAFSTVGALIASRRQENVIGWVFGAAGLLYGITVFAGEYGAYVLLTDPGSLPGGVVAVWIGSWLWIPSGSLILFSFLVFPDGRLPSPRWRFVALLAGLAVCSVTFSSALMPGILEGSPESLPIGNPFGIQGTAAFLDAVGAVSTPLLGATALASVAAVFLRFRRTEGDERQQLKWVAYAVVVMAVAVATSSLSAAVDQSLFGRMLFLVSFLAIPMAFGVAILRYRLWDIDLVTNRTLVYGSLSACVVGIYVLVVGYLGVLLRTDGDNLAISLVAAGLVAVLFQPLRERVQRGVNRLMYGERDDPYEVLSRLGRRLKATDAPEAVLQTIVETVAHTLKLPYAAIALKQDDGAFETLAACGRPQGEPLILPLSYGTETIGQLILSPRAPGEPFGPADHRLLDDLTRHAEAAAYAVRLTTDLQRSRERLVTAREEERRRLRRDLHDGLGPQLATLTLKLDAARNLLSQEDSQSADALLAGIKGQTQAAISDIRRLVYDLRPPALDELGLIPVIREQATNYSQNGLNISVETPGQLPPLPAAVEVATYRIVQEALTNVVRHARARACRIRLSFVGDELNLEIIDDGIGLPEDRRAGVGFSSMRERAAELGGSCAVEPSTAGGTRVLARLPLPASGEKP